MNMFLHIGEDTVITDKKIIGIFDMDTSTVNKATRDFLREAEKKRQCKICQLRFTEEFYCY